MASAARIPAKISFFMSEPPPHIGARTVLVTVKNGYG
jgi:hypothetical protein